MTFDIGYCTMKTTEEIDIEIEACEIALENAYSIQEVDDLTERISELINIRKELDV